MLIEAIRAWVTLPRKIPTVISPRINKNRAAGWCGRGGMVGATTGRMTKANDMPTHRRARAWTSTPPSPGMTIKAAEMRMNTSMNW